MTGGTMFSGIGAPELGLPWVEWKWSSEIEPFPSTVHAARFPHVPNLGDMTRVAWEDVEPVDLVFAGSPCQAFSVAGLRKSLDDARGNLTLEFVRALSILRPRIVVWENVPGVLTTRDNAFGCFLGALVGHDSALVPPRGLKWTRAGLAIGPERAAAWRVFDAQYFGVAQRRRRVFVVACSRESGFDPAAILFELESVRRDSPPSRETGPGIARSLTSSSGGASGKEQQYTFVGGDGRPLNALPMLAKSLNAHASRSDSETETLVPFRADGFDASEDGTGRGTPLVAVEPQAFYPTDGQLNHFPPAGISPPCKVGTGTGEGAIPPAIAFSCKDHGADAGELAPTLRSMHEEDGNANGGGQIAVAFEPRVARNGRGAPEDVVPPLKTQSGRTGTGDSAPHAAGSFGVRRLTPRECERLQGFPDDWTLVEYRRKPAADGPRYKALGNAMAVPVVRWIGERIRRHAETGGDHASVMARV